MTEEFFPSSPTRETVPSHSEDSLYRRDDVSVPSLRGNDASAPVTTKEEQPQQYHLASTFLAAFLGGVLALSGAYLLISADIVRLPASSPAPTVGPTGKPLVETSLASPDWGAVAQAVKPSTVTVRATGTEQGSQGAGFILDTKGHVVTNAHVVSGHETFSIQLDSGFIVEASLVGMDTPTDVAVLAMNNPPKDLQPASLGDSGALVVGQPVAAIGNPLGLSQSVTTGIISSLDRPVSTEGDNAGGQKIATNAIQIDAATNEGNSGGALFDGQGRVIGVNCALASDTSVKGQAYPVGIGFAIPINLVKKIADQLIGDGSARHVRLGVTTKSVWVKAGDISQLGAQVKSVEPSSPASRGGIQVDDTVIAVGESRVTSENSLMGTIGVYQPGDVVALHVVRGMEVISLNVTLGE